MDHLSEGLHVVGRFLKHVAEEKIDNGQPLTKYRLMISKNLDRAGNGAIPVTIPKSRALPQLQENESYLIPVTAFTPANSENIFYTLDTNRPIIKGPVDSSKSEAA